MKTKTYGYRTILLIIVLWGACHTFADTTYKEYKRISAERLGIRVSFSESEIIYLHDRRSRPDVAHFSFGDPDISKTQAVFLSDMAVQMSAGCCIVLNYIKGYKQPFGYTEDLPHVANRTLDNYQTYFDGILRNNYGVPWTNWYDESLEFEWNATDYVKKYRSCGWLEQSNAELGFIIKLPFFEKIQYNGVALRSCSIFSSYDACYCVELFRLHTPLPILMLFLIDTNEERNIIKYVEEACKHIAFNPLFIYTREMTMQSMK